MLFYSLCKEGATPMHSLGKLSCAVKRASLPAEAEAGMASAIRHTEP